MKNYRIIKASDGAQTGLLCHIIDVLDNDTTISSITPTSAIVATALGSETLPKGTHMAVDFTAITLSAGRIGTYDR